jgi:hypothetical protein
MYEHANYLIKEIKTMLGYRGIHFDSVAARMRSVKGEEPGEGDQTILITAARRMDSAWRMFLFDVVERTSLCQLGLRWRIEFMDPLAIAGDET